MISLEHVIEIALLMLFSYLAGCGLGYGIHLAVRALATRPRFEAKLHVQAVAAVVAERAGAPLPPSAARSAARRLAGAVERENIQPAPAESTPAQQRPPDLPSPRSGKADDLKKIKGIGKKTESALNDLGIYHLDQIAAWTPAHVDWLEGRIAVRGRIRREQWVEQATLLVTASAPA